MDVNSVLGLLHLVSVDTVAKVSEAHAISTATLSITTLCNHPRNELISTYKYVILPAEIFLRRDCYLILR
jgi:hypothetical protein